jgi:HEPN domain-containing protein
MNIKEHIKYWENTSNEDYEVFNLLLNSKKYLHAFFFAHLTIEKLIKAHWVKNNNNSVPPKIHNLITLLKQTDINLSLEQERFLAIINDFQIQGRYPDYKKKVNQMLKPDFVENFVPQFTELRKCLLENLV